jgi:hypothetical protein
MAVAAASATEEVEALELARSRLEAALAGDENWRALTRSRAGGDGTGDNAARRARNTRLEMALADNAHYRAWKHLNDAIDALRAKTTARAQAAEPVVRPASAAAATRGLATLPDDVEALLQSDGPIDTPQVAEPDPEPATVAHPTSAGPAGLVNRLERIDGSPEASLLDQGRARLAERQPPPVAADPPEATVTFVVRESRTPLQPPVEPPSDLGTERNSARFDRLRSLDEAPQPAGRTLFHSDVADEEAEVTIVSAERLKQMREADKRSGIVRRFRKALSGD